MWAAITTLYVWFKSLAFISRSQSVFSCSLCREMDWEEAGEHRMEWEEEGEHRMEWEEVGGAATAAATQETSIAPRMTALKGTTGQSA